MKEPKYKLGEIVIVKSEEDKEKICQGKIVCAETIDHEKSCWFYTIEIPLPNNKIEVVYSYEENTGDAKTKFIKSSVTPL